MTVPLPDRKTGQAPDIIARARQYAGASVMVRFNIATVLIGQSRLQWRGTDEEILGAIGFRNTDDYWHVAMSEAMRATEFANFSRCTSSIRQSGCPSLTKEAGPSSSSRHR